MVESDYVWYNLFAKMNNKVNNNMNKQEKRYARIRDMVPGTRFIGNRQGFTFTLMRFPDPETVSVYCQGFPECTIPCLHVETNSVCFVAPHEIVELA